LDLCTDRATDAHEIQYNVAEPNHWSERGRQALQRFGCIDILVNNAAHWEEGGIGEVRADQLDRHYAVNVRASVLLCAEFARNKKPNTPGRIINITSGQNYSPMPGQIAYVVTKSALDALTLTLGSELAGHGITVNAVDPGPTDTGWISDEVSQSSYKSQASPRLKALFAGFDRSKPVTCQLAVLKKNHGGLSSELARVDGRDDDWSTPE
jgi:NAD(P)-dependent dehydrogenase (short-subunit alcohol dehydrogenase family)